MSKTKVTTAEHIKSFNFVASPNAKALILGSMPGVASLDKNQYYAHPRNAFWPILTSLFPSRTSECIDSYEKRLQIIRDNQFALWDVLAECKRHGSLDSNIDSNSIFLNDFASLFTYAPDIKNIIFNGQTAEKLFKRHALAKNNDLYGHFSYFCLPSTSPAYAKMSFADKLAEWQIVKKLCK